MKTEGLVRTPRPRLETEAFCDRVVEAFAQNAKMQNLAPGERLARRGDRPDLYFLVAGELQIVRVDGDHKVELERLPPGSFISDRELVTDSPLAGGLGRVALVATEPSRLCLIPRADLFTLTEETIAHADELRAQIDQRLREQRTRQALRALFPTLGGEVLQALMQVLAFVTINAGESLFQQGDDGDDAFLVVSGRLSVRLLEEPGHSQTIGEVSRGDVVGEFSLFSPAPRSAAVVAIRDSELLRFHRRDFEALCANHPPLALVMARKMVDRVRTSNRWIGPDPSKRTMTLTIVPTCPRQQALDFARQLTRALFAFGTALVVTPDEFERRCGQPDIAQTPVTDPLNPFVVSILSEIENEHRFVIFIADHDPTEWTLRCLRSSDRVLLLANATDDPQPGRLERVALEVALEARHELVLLQPADRNAPTGTAEWLTPRTVAGHHHVQLQRPEHIARVARRLAGRSIGLVLSGGGARGYAHLGVWRALEELEVSVDYIGGTSMGALLAATFAMGLNYREIVQQSETVANPKTLFDYTLPFAALMASRKLTRLCHRLYGQRQVEDLWVPFFSVATNLSTAEQLIYRTGPLWKAVRCSISIPGVFAPVVDEGEVIVDGAVMNNFPVELMREYCESEHVIAVNVSVPRVEQQSYDFAYEVSGWRLLFNRLNPFARRRLHFPAIIGTLMRTMEVNSARHTLHNRSEAQLLLEPNVTSVGLLDFPNFQEASDLGYAASYDALEDWLAEDKLGGQLRLNIGPTAPSAPADG